MKAQAIVQYQLGLVIRLMDSTTCREVAERDVKFHLPSHMKSPLSKDGGTYLFLNIEREDFELGIDVYGYESKKVKIQFSQLDENMPIQEIYLLPLDYPARGREILSLRGNMSGIQAIEAVSLTEIDCSLKEFDERKRIMTILNPHDTQLSYVHYGLLNKEQTRYEKIEIEKQISLTEIKIKEKPEQECVLNQSISKVIHGQVGEDGTYLLKVSDSSTALYLVRYVVDEKVYFQKVDFHQPEELKEGRENEAAGG